MDHAPEAKFEEPTDNRKRAGYGKFLRPNSPYDNFMESRGNTDLPRHRRAPRAGLAAQTVEAHGRERHTISSCSAPRVSGAAMSSKFPGAGALNPEKHLYEEQYLVVDGRGTTEVWVDGNPKKLTFEWQKGSIFAIPMNATYRIVNATSSPALLLAGTTAPNIMNNFGNEDFIFNCPYQFKDRFDPQRRLLQVQRRGHARPTARPRDAQN